MNDYMGLLSSAQQGDYTALRSIMLINPPDYPSPALMQRVAAINQLRKMARGKFIPQPNIPDPAAAAIAEMRSLVPAQAGMLLCTVPPLGGMLAAANGTRYVFFTNTHYTMVTAEKTATSALLLMPAGQYYLHLAIYAAYEDDPEMTQPPFQDGITTVNVMPGAVTEIVPERKNNFSKQTFHVVYH